MLRAISRVALRPTSSFTQVRYFADDASARATTSTQIRLTFATPYEIIANKEPVDSVSVPGADGVFGVFPEHVPLISELRPGVVAVSRKGVVTKHFVAGGFAIIRKGSTVNLSVPEAVPLSYLDASLAKQALDENLRVASSSVAAEDRAAAEIAASVNQAIIHAAAEA